MYSSEANNLNRRYELPTCLLEIWTERSPLSEWRSQIVAQNLRFRLQLAQSRKALEGNQQQIVNLIEAVTAYCDRWLAQDDFTTLEHAIVVPKLSKLKLSTLQLFDLYESLELCANEFVILPNLVLEVRRFHPNWLKIVAGAIAIVGVSIGTIRLISSPFGEQRGYQIAATSQPERVATTTIPEDKSSNVAKSPSSPIPSHSSSPSQPSVSGAVPKVEVPSATLKDTNRKDTNRKDTNRDSKSLESMDKVAIAPEPNISGAVGSDATSNRQRIDNRPSALGSSAKIAPREQPRRLEVPNQAGLDSAAEISKPAPAAPVTLPSISAASRAANENAIATTNLKVLQIQSELPSDITTAFIRYIQSQKVAVVGTTITLELDVSGDRVQKISIDRQDAEDRQNADRQDAILRAQNITSELEKVITEWRSPNAVTGKIRLVLQI
ncbi:DUF4335 domain-containing protein [Pseudanabaena sp. UWO310]|uniref:DUF4335 domain-containing protein n=1 Tax=Pseudanabaena sp. UWO310 TaxID=2480795 RepID=UPI00115A2398|nr:DUF4335 domain-containing protein [Pseudanabaena sp. UWO310]TYQ30898.1 DUF4335 domain-containing protein [Pseudanabaena sp. UWO310]